MSTTTTNLSLIKPVPNVDTDWAFDLNTNSDVLDDAMLTPNVSGAGEVTVIDDGLGGVTISGNAGVHSHSGADITAGVIATTVGGTGSTSQTASRALETDGSADIVSSTVTSTELGRLATVSGNIQDQLDDRVSAGLLQSTSGSLQTSIDAKGDVLSINAATGALTVTGTGAINTATVGTVVTVTLLSGTVDHGTIGGLSDDDHTQYVLADGTRDMSGVLTLRKAVPEIDFKDTANGDKIWTIGGEGGELYIAEDDSTAANRRVVVSGSLVGINTDTPTDALHVVGSGVFTGDLTVNQETNFTGQMTATSGTFTGGITSSGLPVFIQGVSEISASGTAITNQVILEGEDRVVLHASGQTVIISGTTEGLVETMDGVFATVQSGIAFTIRQKVKYPFLINSIDAQTSSGTATLTVKINSTNVTGLSSIAVLATEVSSTATANNLASVGDKVVLSVDVADADADNLSYTLKTTRTQP